MKGPFNRGGGVPILNGMALCTQNVHMSNIPKHKLVPRACDPREGTRGSGIIRFREESDWPFKWNA
jgi:hypothetical protein